MLLLELFLLSISSLTTQQEAILNCLRAQLDKPFTWGASGPNSFDSSGLSRYCQEAANITGLPHTPLLQSQVGKMIDCAQAEVGDQIFFYTPVSHVGTFSSHVGVIHAVNEDKAITEYPNIFTNGFWGPLITVCRRNWNDDPGVPARTPAATATVVTSRSPAASRTARATSAPLPGLSADQSSILTCLERQFGFGYLPLGEDPSTGFDASGLVRYCFDEAGIGLEHGAASQASSGLGSWVDCTDAHPGDLVFSNSPVTFVGTFRTPNDVIQVSDTADGVKLYPGIFENAYYTPTITMCK
jgi:cell wall-associated NlpC family hydrolase